jgi:K+-sensing histidine kinase KdpD
MVGWQDWQDLIFLALGLVGGWSFQKVRPASIPHAPDPTTPVARSSKPTDPWTEQPPSASPDSLSEIMQAYQRLQVVEGFKSGFLARTAHELRSPINSLIGLHQLILEDLCETPQEEREFIRQAKDAALKILSLLDILIAAAKLDSGREPVHLQTTSVAALFESVKALSQLQAANHNLRYEVILPSPDLMVMSDSQWLQTLLINLIEDAISNSHLGTLRLWAGLNGDPQKVDLCLQADRPLSDLQTSLQALPYTPAIDIANLENIRLSTRLTLAVAQTMLVSLQGQLSLEAPPDTDQVALIRCTLPRA